MDVIGDAADHEGGRVPFFEDAGFVGEEFGP